MNFSKKQEEKMRKVDWYWFFIFIMMMTIVGFLLFDNIASKLIFGIVVGGIFGWIFATKKSRKKE
jgi:positive regulator of sigma E activity